MSKGIKKKVSVKILPGEAVFVSSVEVLQHIAETYVTLSENCETQEDKLLWLSVSEDINNWISQTYYSGQENEQEEEW